MAALKALIARWRSDSGAEFVEFALSFPLLLLVVLGIIDFGLLFQQYEVITNAAREGARVGMASTYSLTDAQARAQAYVTNSRISGGNILTMPTPTATKVPIDLGGGKTVCGVKVQVQYQHNYFGYFSGWLGSKTLTGS